MSEATLQDDDIVKLYDECNEDIASGDPITRNRGLIMRDLIPTLERFQCEVTDHESLLAALVGMGEASAAVIVTLLKARAAKDCHAEVTDNFAEAMRSRKCVICSNAQTPLRKNGSNPHDGL